MKIAKCFMFFFVLTILSLYILWRNGADEPYVFFDKNDALFQIGASSILLSLWGQFYIYLLFNAKKLPFVCLFSILGGLLCILILLVCINGYINDISEFSKKLQESSYASPHRLDCNP
jgi:hypothetical protein